jgi:hypothetical protein
LVTLKEMSEESFPDVAIAEGAYGPCIYVSDHAGSVASWTYQDVAQDPLEWEKCLRVVMLAAKMGGHAARRYLEDQRRSDPEAVAEGALLCCSVCDQEFNLHPMSVHRISSKLGGKRYFEYQCSEICTQKRVKALVTSECGENFVQQVFARMATQPLKNRSRSVE